MDSIGSFFEPIKLITNHFCLKNTFEKLCLELYFETFSAMLFILLSLEINALRNNAKEDFPVP